MRHPTDGEAWKDFDDTFKSFADDPHNLMDLTHMAR